MALKFKLPEGIQQLPATGASAVGKLSNLRLRKRAHRPKPVNCLNCGDSLAGNFCANCGQEAEDHRTALWPLISDVLSEFARWDSKFARTIVPLLFRPGFLTNEYNAGKRAKYLSPFKMYLTVSLIFFLVLSIHPSKIISTDSSPDSHAPVSISIDSDKNDPQKAQKLAVAAQSLKEAASSAAGTPAAPILGMTSSVMKIASATAQPTAVAKPADPYATVPKLLPTASGSIHLLGDDVEVAQLPKTQALYDKLQNDPKYPFHNRGITRRFIDHVYNLIANRDLFNKTFLDLLPKTMFVTLPIFGLILYGLYWRSRRYYVEHLVFALHDHTFVFLAMTLMLLPLPSFLVNLLPLAIIAYLFISMLVVYREGAIKTFAKYAVASFSYWVLLMFALLLTLAFAFWTM